VPSEVLTIQNSELKYLLILRLALSRPDLSYAGTANPTTMLALIRLYREHAAMLIRDVREGGFFRCADKVRGGFKLAHYAVEVRAFVHHSCSSL